MEQSTEVVMLSTECLSYQEQVFCKVPDSNGEFVMGLLFSATIILLVIVLLNYLNAPMRKK